MRCKCIGAHIGCFICAVGTLQSLCVLANQMCWRYAAILVLLFGSLTIILARVADSTTRRMHMTRLQILQAAQTKIAGHSSNCGRL